MLSKEELRVLITLRTMAIHKQESGADARPRDLMRADGGLVVDAWVQLGIDRFYPYRMHLPQLYQALERLVECGLLDKRSDREKTSDPAYVINERGLTVAQGLTDEWKKWPALASVCK